MKVAELSGIATMACTVHHGPLSSIGEAYDALVKWIATNGYQIAGPAREVYLRESRTQNDPESLTDVQFPVGKA